MHQTTMDQINTVFYTVASSHEVSQTQTPIITNHVRRLLIRSMCRVKLHGSQR